MPGSASAAKPVLEFVTPGRSLPVSFATQGGPVVAELAGFERVVHCAASSGTGEITGPRSTVSSYEFTGCVARNSKSEVKCQSEGASPEEIRTGPIAAELVDLDQAQDEVGILLNPGGGIYMTFRCGGELTEARGPFLASVAPINKEASSFTATLAESGAMQMPDEYENATGEKLKAVPEGKRENGEWATTGVASTFTVDPSVPVEVRAITAAEVEAEQREEEARQRAQHKHEEEAIAGLTAKRHQEEEAAKKHHEEEPAAEKKPEEVALAALEAAIDNARTASDKAPRIAVLLKHGGLTLAFSASEPGKLVIQWWQVPPGAHPAKIGKPRPVLVAQGEAVFSGAGTDKVEISFTPEGHHMLAHAIKLKLRTQVRFTPTAHPTISATGVLTLRR